jgi:hypothetical protein
VGLSFLFAIHILAMLLVGFGFLMVFVKRYGYGATTGTYLIVAMGIPLYLGLRATEAKQKAYKDYDEFDAVPEP